MAETRVDDELWNEFHRVVNERVYAERRDDLEPAQGQASWRHRLMSLGHDPLKAP